MESSSVNTGTFDVATRLLSASVTSDAWRSLMIEAYDEIIWLRKEMKMWRRRATGVEPADKRQG